MRPLPRAPPPAQVVGASAGRNHTAVVTATGESYSFGLNSYGQLGTGSVKKLKGAEDMALTPQLVGAAPLPPAEREGRACCCCCCFCCNLFGLVAHTAGARQRVSWCPWQGRGAHLPLFSVAGRWDLARLAVLDGQRMAQVLHTAGAAVPPLLQSAGWAAVQSHTAATLHASSAAPPTPPHPAQSLVSKCSKVGCGVDFTMWLCEGKLWSAGCPQYGQLGHGTDNSYNAGALAPRCPLGLAARLLVCAACAAGSAWQARLCCLPVGMQRACCCFVRPAGVPSCGTAWAVSRLHPSYRVWGPTAVARVFPACKAAASSAAA